MEKAETWENGIRKNQKPEVRTAATIELVSERLEHEYGSGTNTLTKIRQQSYK
jgi:hypothetical protein